MRWIKVKLSGVMFLLLAVAASAATTVYVSPIGNNTPPFDTWPKAATNIKAAIDVAANSDVVLVTNGNYLLTTQIVVTNGVTLRSVNGATLTTVDGQYPTLSNRCVYLSHTGAVLDGFTVIRGCTNGGVGGGGIWIGKGRAQNCTVVSNYSDANGGGIYLQTGTVWNCVVTTNGAVGGGGGICIENVGGGDTGAAVSNCVIQDNYTVGWGGGIYLIANGTIDSCVISNNHISSSHLYGGGVLMGGYDGVQGGMLRNSLIVNNSSTLGGGGGVAVWRRAVIENCTIVSNYCGGEWTVKGGGICAGLFENPEPVSASLRNCIIYANTCASSVAGNNYYLQYGALLFTNCCALPLPATAGSTNNIAVDPLFDVNYRLHIRSPCINAGTNQDWMTNALDLDGNTRILNGIVDIGAYEKYLWHGTIIMVH